MIETWLLRALPLVSKTVKISTSPLQPLGLKDGDWLILTQRRGFGLTSIPWIRYSFPKITYSRLLLGRVVPDTSSVYGGSLDLYVPRYWGDSIALSLMRSVLTGPGGISPRYFALRGPATISTHPSPT